MKNYKKIGLWCILVVSLVTGTGAVIYRDTSTDKIVSYVVDPKARDIQFYWKDDKGEIFKSIQRLKDHLDQKNSKLVFAMNGGMFKADNSPQGLFIQQKARIAPLDTASGSGNFYLKPNGVFYITVDKNAIICQTTDFVDNGRIEFATQSGPMLLINGAFHPAFKKGSSNLNIRNGVGLLPDHKLLFAMSKEPINFYDFANYFKQAGCENALYLDGFVSRTYLPEEKWIQTDGNFGVIIGAAIQE
ncbi:MAG TPA: phosphodiester glycosidase family protein [Chryseolinea sp.]